MDTSKLKKFAQFARRSLIEQVSAKLKLVLAPESAARREQPRAVAELEEQIQAHGKEQVVEKVAYTWFNRICAFRFMDVNRYTRIGLVSPAEGQFQPEILAEAKMGHIDEDIVSGETGKQIFALLSGTSPSPDAQSEAYRLLVVAACNYWNKAMPFLFQRINDYTELLMPDDLLSGNSILAYTREAMTPNACEDVEVIGWLYQFYISEKKDEVFDGLKKNKKITPENIPAATQLFTPHWIVRYLVENSLGRLWLLNRPGSKLIEQMDYYIQPEQAETDFLRISKPEEIKICDPACGSGHMLTYAFDLLYAIYEEEGYEPAEIPEKILTNNLYGIEIDERAGELAAFALTMKARAKQRRFFNKGVKPNICVLENVHFDEGELKNYIDFVGRDLFTAPLQTTLRQFEEADNFGSLIRPTAINVDGMLEILASKDVSGQLFISMTHRKILQALRQADYLSPKYHVVIANPPYMNSSGMDKSLKSFIDIEYTDYKADLFSSFIVRVLALSTESSYMGFVTPFSWMYLSSFEKLRQAMFSKSSLTNLVQLEYNAFEPAMVSVCAFIIQKDLGYDLPGVFIQLSGFKGHKNQGPRTLEAINNPACGWRFKRKRSDFLKIPGMPIAFEMSNEMISAFEKMPKVSDFADTRIGLVTGDNNRYIRYWSEVSYSKIGFNLTRKAAGESSYKWFPQSKGGDFRRWFGNNDTILDWSDDGNELQNRPHASGKRTLAHNFNLDMIFKSGITWTKLSASKFGVRLQPSGFLFNDASANAFPKNDCHLLPLLGYLGSNVCREYLNVLNPTLNFLPGNISDLPIPNEIMEDSRFISNVCKIIELTKVDWDSYERSWDFNHLPLITNVEEESISSRYIKLREINRERIKKLNLLEFQNNEQLKFLFGLSEHNKNDTGLEGTTLTCNPHYRYGNDKSEEELETLLLADTMRELFSYAVGCMFGRYALGKPGLILANQGETVDDYLKRVPEPIFPADTDNVIPMLDENWFPDDITERFRTFLKTAFGEEQFEANLKFIEKALGKDIRKFFLKDFYTDHIKRYKKRPIYWLFSSPKGSFNALIYMHRYRPDTVSTVLQYLRDFRSKLANHVQHLRRVEVSSDASKGEKTKALKDIDAYSKVIAELDAYERDTLYPLATEQISIDLDNGVKANYLLFGSALKKIPGLEAKEE